MIVNRNKQYKFLTVGRRNPPVFLFIGYCYAYQCTFCKIKNTQMCASNTKHFKERCQELTMITGIESDSPAFCISCLDLMLNDVDTLVFKYNMGLL